MRYIDMGMNNKKERKIWIFVGLSYLLGMVTFSWWFMQPAQSRSELLATVGWFFLVFALIMTVATYNGSFGKSTAVQLQRWYDLNTEWYLNLMMVCLGVFVLYDIRNPDASTAALNAMLVVSTVILFANLSMTKKALLAQKARLEVLESALLEREEA